MSLSLVKWPRGHFIRLGLKQFLIFRYSRGRWFIHQLASYVEDRQDRKSNTGYIFKINGAAIIWCSRKQTCHVLSSTEAELIALTETVKEGLWLRRLFRDFHQNINHPITVFEDSTSCIKIVANDKNTRPSKHIDVRYFFVKDVIRKNIFICKQMFSQEMIADILTKPLLEIVIM